jgi:adenylate cyclase
MRYNFACTYISEFKDIERGLDILESSVQLAQLVTLNWIKIDTDLDAARDHPRFKAMMARAEARLAATD